MGGFPLSMSLSALVLGRVVVKTRGSVSITPIVTYLRLAKVGSERAKEQ